jgi:hypothetical protein
MAHPGRPGLPRMRDERGKGGGVAGSGCRQALEAPRAVLVPSLSSDADAGLGPQSHATQFHETRFGFRRTNPGRNPIWVPCSDTTAHVSPLPYAPTTRQDATGTIGAQSAVMLAQCLVGRNGRGASFSQGFQCPLDVQCWWYVGLSSGFF